MGVWITIKEVAAADSSAVRQLLSDAAADTSTAGLKAGFVSEHNLNYPSNPITPSGITMNLATYYEGYVPVDVADAPLGATAEEEESVSPGIAIVLSLGAAILCLCGVALCWYCVRRKRNENRNVIRDEHRAHLEMVRSSFAQDPNAPPNSTIQNGEATQAAVYAEPPQYNSAPSIGVPMVQLEPIESNPVGLPMYAEQRLPDLEDMEFTGEVSPSHSVQGDRGEPMVSMGVLVMEVLDTKEDVHMHEIPNKQDDPHGM